MKKIFFYLISASLLFSSSNENIDKKLDLILNKLNNLEQKLKEKDKEIEKLKKELQKQKISTKEEFAIKDCKNIKITSLQIKYHDNVLPYYTIKIGLTNKYPYETKTIKGNLYIDDKEGTTLLKHYIKRDIKIKPNETKIITIQHMIGTELEKYLKDENPHNLNPYFIANEIYFKNNQTLKCK